MAQFVDTPEVVTHLQGPSTRSFFTDPIQPKAFTSMDEWTALRDFLYTFGVKYKYDGAVDDGVYTDRRR